MALLGLSDDEMYSMAGNMYSANSFDSPSTPSSGGGFDLTSLATPLSILGTGVKAFGEYEQGKEIAGAYKYNAALVQQGLDFDLHQIDVQSKDLAGNQAAAYAKAGVTMSGSPLQVALKTATNIELDKQVATYNAQSKINMYNYQAGQARQKADFNISSTLLSGAFSLSKLFL